MKRNRFLSRSIALLTALVLILSVGALTVFAAPEDEQQEQYIEYNEPETPQDEPQDTPADIPQDTPQEEPVDQPETPQDTPAETPQVEPEQGGWIDYIYNYEEATSAYEAPEHLDELPQVASEQVVEATAVVMPNVAVSDASLFSGIVMWLCVALGIAVIVGVLVSKRTRRRGA